MRPPLPVGFLRVYQPVDALGVDERDRYSQGWADADRVDRDQAAEIELEAGTVAAVVGSRLPAMPADAALTIDRDGVRYVCPLRVAERAAAAIVAFRRTLPEPVVDRFLPAPLVAAADAAGARAVEAGRAAPVRSSAWRIPLPWFSLVEAEERRLVLDHRSGQSLRSLTYLTTMIQARARLGRSYEIARGAFGDSGPVFELAELGRWLSSFDERSLIEIDYGTLVSLFTDEELGADESAADIGLSVAALATGDGESAFAHYSPVVKRWQSGITRESCN